MKTEVVTAMNYSVVGVQYPANRKVVLIGYEHLKHVPIIVIRASGDLKKLYEENVAPLFRNYNFQEFVKKVYLGATSPFVLHTVELVFNGVQIPISNYATADMVEEEYERRITKK